MMIKQTKLICGIKVQIFERSFKVMDDKYNSPIIFPPNLTEDAIERLITTIYDIVKDQAIEAAIDEVANNAQAMVKDFLRSKR